MSKLVKPLSIAMFITAMAALAAVLFQRSQGDVAVGKRLVENHCAICHDVGPTQHNEKGPYLWAIVGREAGAAEGYHYSGAFEERIRSVPFHWTPENLDAFLSDPMDFIPDVMMAHQGARHEAAFEPVKEAANRRDVIAYLETLGSNAE